MRIGSYNISGGFYNSEDKTDYLDKEAVEAVDNKMLQQIIDTINSEKIDVICFQEIITTEKVQYIQSICNGTELKYFDFYELSECNIVKDTNCGIAVLSRYPLETIKKELFPNPGLTKTTKTGKTYYLFDKGYMVVEIMANNKNNRLLVNHGFPYGTFNSTSEDNPQVFEFFDNAIKELNPDIITGDFNAENFMELMKYTSDNYIRTINDATTVEGHKIDDFLVKENTKYDKKILKLLSDHYMIIIDIE